jgi:hypothetical protein
VNGRSRARTPAVLEGEPGLRPDNAAPVPSIGVGRWLNDAQEALPMIRGVRLRLALRNVVAAFSDRVSADAGSQ